MPNNLERQHCQLNELRFKLTLPSRQTGPPHSTTIPSPLPPLPWGQQQPPGTHLASAAPPAARHASTSAWLQDHVRLLDRPPCRKATGPPRPAALHPTPPRPAPHGTPPAATAVVPCSCCSCSSKPTVPTCALVSCSGSYSNPPSPLPCRRRHGRLPCPRHVQAGRHQRHGGVGGHAAVAGPTADLEVAVVAPQLGPRVAHLHRSDGVVGHDGNSGLGTSKLRSRSEIGDRIVLALCWGVNHGFRTCTCVGSRLPVALSPGAPTALPHPPAPRSVALSYGRTYQPEVDALWAGAVPVQRDGVVQVAHGVRAVRLVDDALRVVGERVGVWGRRSGARTQHQCDGVKRLAIRSSIWRAG